VQAVKKQLGLLVVALVVVLVAAGSLARAAAGPEPNDPQDTVSFWSSDGVHLAFERQIAGGTTHVLQMTSAGKDLYVDDFGAVLRGWVPGTDYKLIEVDGNTIMTTGGRFAAPHAEFHGVDASASPDGSRVAYLRNGTLYVARIDALPKADTTPIPVPAEQSVATGVDPPSWDLTGPAWSPDSTRIVIASGSTLLLVNADGSGSRVLFSGQNQSVNPTWSPSGTHIAFERNAAPHWQIWTVKPDGTGAGELVASGGNDRYPRYSPVSDQLAFISGRQHVQGGATQFQFALYLMDAGGGTHKLVDDVHPFAPPSWSPTAALIAVAAGQECRRWGIYIVRSNTGARPTRRSNLCRYDGTAGADTIHASPYFDIVNGLGGNDHLYGSSGNDAIYGENGNDVIDGQDGNDTIFGGPGNDVISGGSGDDVIIPGNGRDVVDCGPGIDTVEGAGPLDRINKNCEHVRH
jgi:Tol biopolymer transport system component